MKKRAIFFSILLMVAPLQSSADIFGGDVVVLTQILVQTIQQLVQLKQIFQEGKDSLDLVKEINRGINDSLNLVRTVYPDIDPGIYKDWDKIDRALHGVQEIYGALCVELLYVSRLRSCLVCVLPLYYLQALQVALSIRNPP